MKGDNLGRQGGSGSQKRNHEGRQAWETRRQRQPRAKSGRETSLEDKPAAAAKREIMKGDKLGRQGGSGSGSQFLQSGTHPLRSKNPYSFAIWGIILGAFINLRRKKVIILGYFINPG